MELANLAFLKNLTAYIDTYGGRLNYFAQQEGKEFAIKVNITIPCKQNDKPFFVAFHFLFGQTACTYEWLKDSVLQYRDTTGYSAVTLEEMTKFIGQTIYNVTEMQGLDVYHSNIRDVTPIKLMSSDVLNTFRPDLYSPQSFVLDYVLQKRNLEIRASGKMSGMASFNRSYAIVIAEPFPVTSQYLHEEYLQEQVKVYDILKTAGCALDKKGFDDVVARFKTKNISV